MAVTIAGITCEELVADYAEEYDIMGGPSAVKKYLCPWANRFTVAHGFLGLSSAPLPGGLITLNLPLPFPELAAESTSLLASMYARNVAIQGVGSPFQGPNNIAFTSAIVTVTFGNFPWTFAGIDYNQLDPTRPYIFAEQHIDFSNEFITVPQSSGGAFVNPGTGRIPLNQDWGFFSPLADMTITLKQVPYLLAPQTLNALQAPINSVAYLGCAPGFLMFGGGQDHRTKNPDGTQTSEFTLNFKYRPIAQWDQIYYKGSWLQVTDTSGNPIIGRSDLSLIIPTTYVA
jgi:hypothetical protein